jgi:hypothetical protein
MHSLVVSKMTTINQRKKEQAVVKAAVAWVQFEDHGTLQDLGKETELRQQLVEAVEKLGGERR